MGQQTGGDILEGVRHVCSVPTGGSMTNCITNTFRFQVDTDEREIGDLAFAARDLSEHVPGIE